MVMAVTTPKMGLNAWDQLPDLFDHNQLAADLFKIDQHDHTPGRGVLIPTEGIEPGAITGALLASGTITDSLLVTNAWNNLALASSVIQIPNTFTPQSRIEQGGTVARLRGGIYMSAGTLGPLATLCTVPAPSKVINGSVAYTSSGNTTIAGTVAFSINTSGQLESLATLGTTVGIFLDTITYSLS